MSKNKDKDFTGQTKEVLVSTERGGIKKIKADRSGDALRKALPPTALSQRKKR